MTESLASTPVSEQDRRHIASLIAEDATRLAKSRLFLTGGTGFVGSWILEALRQVNDACGGRILTTVLTRDVVGWKQRRPHLADAIDVNAVAGDVLKADWQQQLPSDLDLLIHAAFDSGRRPGSLSPLQVLETILDGTRNTVVAAIERGVRRILFISSGAVYGPFTQSGVALTEESTSGPDPLTPNSAYGEGKRAAEAWAAAYCNAHDVEFVSARLFAFAGPYLPLNGHFAFGSFLGDAIAKRTVTLNSSGASVRSWLYGADLAVWLIRMLVSGRSGTAYNVGSDEAQSVLELANMMADIAGLSAPEIHARPSTAMDTVYVPDISRAREELGLEVTISLKEAIQRSLDYYTLTD